ncbi:MAG: Rv3235 family protein [Actinomycetes bacterium]
MPAHALLPTGPPTCRNADSLPDPVPSRPHLHLLPPPTWSDAVPAHPPGPGQQVLALEFLLPNGLPAIPLGQCPPSLERHEPDVTPWAARLAQAVLEVEAAERPVQQLTRWVLPEIYRRLDRRQQVRARQVEQRGTRVRSPEHVRSVHICHPCSGVAEVTVVTAGADRCRALALRLERRRERWMCTALDWA